MVQQGLQGLADRFRPLPLRVGIEARPAARVPRDRTPDLVRDLCTNIGSGGQAGNPNRAPVTAGGAARTRRHPVEPAGAKGYSGIIRFQRAVRMRRATALILIVLFLAAPLVAAGSRSDARAQVEFGISVALQGLWKEAIYRWQKAVEIDPTYAAAYNNLAIAYEHEGLFDKAREAYEQASKLDPKNIYIKQNIEYFREINDRAKSEPPR